MFCGKCGSQIIAGSNFCPVCSSNKTGIKNESHNVGMPLQKFVGNMYSVLMEIIMWLLPIAGFIALGNLLGYYDFHFGYALLGLIVGLLLDVILFGPIIILMNIRSSLKNIENK
jgi:Na+/H+-dicarboxylate symporter